MSVLLETPTIYGHALARSHTRAPSAPSTPALSTAVGLRVGCWKLVKRDLFSETDPFIVVYLTEMDNERREIARTETATDTSNVSFQSEIHVDFRREESQMIRLEVYDRESPSEELHEQQPLGCAEITMVELMTTKSMSPELPLQQPANSHIPELRGTVTISAEELSACTDHVTVQFGADNLDNKDGWFGKSDPFLSILHLRDPDADPSEASSWVHVWKSEVIKNELNPRWEKSTISVQTLCNGDLTKLLHFQCWDWDPNGRHELIGACSMTAGEFLSSKNLTMDLINDEIRAKRRKKYINSGVLRVVSLEKEEEQAPSKPPPLQPKTHRPPTSTAHTGTVAQLNDLLSELQSAPMLSNQVTSIKKTVDAANQESYRRWLIDEQVRGQTEAMRQLRGTEDLTAACEALQDSPAAMTSLLRSLPYAVILHADLGDAILARYGRAVMITGRMAMMEKLSQQATSEAARTFFSEWHNAVAVAETTSMQWAVADDYVRWERAHKYQAHGFQVHKVHNVFGSPTDTTRRLQFEEQCDRLLTWMAEDHDNVRRTASAMERQYWDASTCFFDQPRTQEPQEPPANA